MLYGVLGSFGVLMWLQTGTALGERQKVAAKNLTASKPDWIKTCLPKNLL